MRTSIFLATALSLVMTPALVAAQTPGKPAPNRASGVVGPKAMQVTGTLEHLFDGEIVVALELPADQVARVAKLPSVDEGWPATPGRLGHKDGKVWVRYQLAPSADLLDQAKKLLGRRISVDLGADRLVTGMKRVP
ncbi:hypothetical protein L6R52_03075 [Myxococcota bacterium]|nr:hypothetical protein [Myxococcota bacterium]